MHFQVALHCRKLMVLAASLCPALACGGEPPAAPDTAEQTAAELVSVPVARDRAKLLHNVYAATLDVMHERYFHDEKAIVPARALEDVFAELSRQSKVEARWISVNTKAMSVGHEPKGEFELLAAKEIAAGKEAFEQVKDGRYYRAAPIPLAAGCVSCHMGFFSAAPKSPRFAGLVISIPVEKE